MAQGRNLRIFVAMPVKAMGEGAPWSDVKEIRAKLLAPAATEIGRRLDRPVDLVIEDEKKASGHIPTSMFAEAVDADVYIADLTGYSANVFLELGVRWAVADAVTILIAQDTSNLKFNVAFNRAIEYGPMPTQLETAISDLADYAIAGLNEGVVDSPVRAGGRLITLPREEVESLRVELAGLRMRRGDDLLKIAAASPDALEQIRILQQAVAVNPVSVDARMALGEKLRETGQYADSVREFSVATELAPRSADAWRELGTSQSKSGELTAAADSFRTSLELDPQQAETWRVLGGLRRRLARNAEGVIVDWDQFRESRDAYSYSVSVDPDQSYGLFNLWLISLVIALHDGLDTTEIIREFDTLLDLCEYKVKRNPGDPWKRLDLAGTLAILEREAEALKEVELALEAAGASRELSYVDSAVPPLRDALHELDEGAIRYRAISAIVEKLSTARSLRQPV